MRVWTSHTHSWRAGGVTYIYEGLKGFIINPRGAEEGHHTYMSGSHSSQSILDVRLEGFCSSILHTHTLTFNQVHYFPHTLPNSSRHACSTWRPVTIRHIAEKIIGVGPEKDPGIGGERKSSIVGVEASVVQHLRSASSSGPVSTRVYNISNLHHLPVSR
jgi:hypothetical protein